MMRLYFMLERRNPPGLGAVLTRVFEILTRRGFEVEANIAEDVLTQPDQLEVEHDLYLLKSHTGLSLSLARILHARGARMLNPFPSCVEADDKIAAWRRLRAAGIPTPDAWATGDVSLIHTLVAERALIVKPCRGYHGSGVHIVRNADDVAALPPMDEPLIIQEYIEGPGADLKVYVVGDEMFAVRKLFSATSYTQKGKTCALSDEVRQIALRCGQAFGLGLYGLDIIESASGPVVVDLNYFPGYNRGVPDFAPLIAAYIEGYAREQFTLELPDLRQLLTERESCMAAATT
jgi:ribosomal protein S6--L-glutamate ligase